jgi:formylglycine-generating enzyme required for sulfatase activity
VLVPQAAADDPPTFYITEDKVWNAAFAPFAAKYLDAGMTQWHKGGQANGEDVGVANGRLPVLRVTAAEADQYARWLGGRLPAARQWDKAAGRFEKDRGEGPFRESCAEGDVAVNRRDKGPKEVGTAAGDVSRFGCRDMAGNGYELTRDLVGDDKRTVPLDPPDPMARVLLRGRAYTLPRPLRFEDLDDELSLIGQDYGRASDLTGFRVVIEP